MGHKSLSHNIISPYDIWSQRQYVGSSGSIARSSSGGGGVSSRCWFCWLPCLDFLFFFFPVLAVVVFFWLPLLVFDKELERVSDITIISIALEDSTNVSVLVLLALFVCLSELLALPEEFELMFAFVSRVDSLLSCSFPKSGRNIPRLMWIFVSVKRKGSVIYGSKPYRDYDNPNLIVWIYFLWDPELAELFAVFRLLFLVQQLKPAEPSQVLSS